MMMHHTDLPRVMDRAEVEATIRHQMRPSDQEAARRMWDGLYADEPAEPVAQPVRAALTWLVAATAVGALILAGWVLDMVGVR